MILVMNTTKIFENIIKIRKKGLQNDKSPIKISQYIIGSLSQNLISPRYSKFHIFYNRNYSVSRRKPLLSVRAFGDFSRVWNKFDFFIGGKLGIIIAQTTS